MLHRFTQHLLLCPPVGFSKGYHLSYWSIDDVILLPAEALHLIWVSQPIRAVPAQMPFCACPMHLSGLLRPSFLFPAFKGKTSPDY